MKIGGNAAGNGNSGGDREGPEADIYEGVIGVISDVGLHDDRNSPGVPKRKVVVGVEIDWRDSKGRREVLFKKFNLSLWRKEDGSKSSDFRAFLDGARPDAVAKSLADGKDIDTDEWVGVPVRVQVEVDAKGRAFIKGFMRSKAKPGAPDTMKPERDYGEPFGLWKWLLANGRPAS